MAEHDPLDLAEIDRQVARNQTAGLFHEASLVRRLEELGRGRPSTYASIITTIQDRGYVWKKATAMVPSFTAFAKVTLLERHFPNLIDYTLTARMETTSTRSPAARSLGPVVGPVLLRERKPGSAQHGHRPAGRHRRTRDQLDPDRHRPGWNRDRRPGRPYGPDLERGEESASIPDQAAPDELTVKRPSSCCRLERRSGAGSDPATGRSGSSGRKIRAVRPARRAGRKR